MLVDPRDVRIHGVAWTGEDVLDPLVIVFFR